MSLVKDDLGVGGEVRPKNPLVHFLIDNDLLMQLLDMLQLVNLNFLIPQLGDLTLCHPPHFFQHFLLLPLGAC
jgi:hypothetical protein